MRGVRTVIFDLDDTLIETGPVYDRALDRFLEVMGRALPGADLPEVKRLQEEIDVEAVREVGFVKDRFPWSLAETYRVVCGKAGVPVDATVVDQVTALGFSVFDGVPRMFDGVRELLEELRQRYQLRLYTLGVPEVQLVKVRHHGLDALFHQVHVVREKSVDQLRRVVGACRPEEVLVVGDSMRGEIGPALELGCHAAWVRRPQQWQYHRAEVSGAYVTVDDVTELRRLLSQDGKEQT
jgi:putative hydrolase of the HAD superfamily